MQISNIFDEFWARVGREGPEKRNTGNNRYRREIWDGVLARDTVPDSTNNYPPFVHRQLSRPPRSCPPPIPTNSRIAQMAQHRLKLRERDATTTATTKAATTTTTKFVRAWLSTIKAFGNSVDPEVHSLDLETSKRARAAHRKREDVPPPSPSWLACIRCSSSTRNGIHLVCADQTDLPDSSERESS